MESFGTMQPKRLGQLIMLQLYMLGGNGTSIAWRGCSRAPLSGAQAPICVEQEGSVASHG